MAAQISVTPYAAVGMGANPFSLIQAVVNGTSESQKSRCAFAQRIAPVNGAMTA